MSAEQRLAEIAREGLSAMYDRLGAIDPEGEAGRESDYAEEWAELEALEAELNALYPLSFSFTVSAGHAEYMLSDEVCRVVWDPSEAELDEAGEAVPTEALEAVRSRVMRGDDIDFGWETVLDVECSRAALEAETERLLHDVEVAPSGDDQTFDYWPSGARLLRDLAEVLGGDWPARAEKATRAAAAETEEWAGEILQSAGYNVRDEDCPVPPGAVTE